MNSITCPVCGKTLWEIDSEGLDMFHHLSDHIKEILETIEEIKNGL